MEINKDVSVVQKAGTSIRGNAMRSVFIPFINKVLLGEYGSDVGQIADIHVVVRFSEGEDFELLSRAPLKT